MQVGSFEGHGPGYFIPVETDLKTLQLAANKRALKLIKQIDEATKLAANSTLRFGDNKL